MHVEYILLHVYISLASRQLLGVSHNDLHGSEVSTPLPDQPCFWNERRGIYQGLMYLFFSYEFSESEILGSSFFLPRFYEIK